MLCIRSCILFEGQVAPYLLYSCLQLEDIFNQVSHFLLSQTTQSSFLTWQMPILYKTFEGLSRQNIILQKTEIMDINIRTEISEEFGSIYGCKKGE